MWSSSKTAEQVATPRTRARLFLPAASLVAAIVVASCAGSSGPVVADVTFGDVPTDLPENDAPSIDAGTTDATIIDAPSQPEATPPIDATPRTDTGPAPDIATDAPTREVSTGPCARGLANCGDGCIDLLTADAHCGHCDIACPAAATCRNGECACPTGQALCGGECITPGAPCAWESPECAPGGVQCAGNTPVCAPMAPFAAAGTRCEGRYQNMACNGRGRCGCPDSMTCVWCEESCQTFDYCSSHPVCP